MFTFADTTCDVDFEGKNRGSVAGGIGGYYILRDSIRGVSYALRPDDAWHLFQAEMKRLDEERK